MSARAPGIGLVLRERRQEIASGAFSLLVVLFAVFSFFLGPRGERADLTRERDDKQAKLSMLSQPEQVPFAPALARPLTTALRQSVTDPGVQAEFKRLADRPVSVVAAGGAEDVTGIGTVQRYRVTVPGTVDQALSVGYRIASASIVEPTRVELRSSWVWIVETARWSSGSGEIVVAVYGRR